MKRTIFHKRYNYELTKKRNIIDEKLKEDEETTTNALRKYKVYRK